MVCRMRDGEREREMRERKGHRYVVGEIEKICMFDDNEH